MCRKPNGKGTYHAATPIPFLGKVKRYETRCGTPEPKRGWHLILPGPSSTKCRRCF